MKRGEGKGDGTDEPQMPSFPSPSSSVWGCPFLLLLLLSVFLLFKRENWRRKELGAAHP